MRKTNVEPVEFKDKLAMGSAELSQALGCGKPMAIQIGSQAKARVQVGKRVLWNLNKIQRYLDSIATE